MFFQKGKGFSVAEATIALLIGSIALGMSAPMITKQVKQNNFADAERRMVIKQLENLLPSGAVMYFDLDFCPRGWSPLTNTYPQAAGSFLRNLGEVPAEGEKVRTRGSYQSSALPDIDLALRIEAYFDDIYSVRLDEYGFDDWAGSMLLPTANSDEPVYVMSSADKKNRAGDLIKSDIYNKNVKEVRPNNIALLACRKD